MKHSMVLAGLLATFLLGCNGANEDAKWKDATTDRANKQALLEFLKQYPEGKYSEDAKRKIVDLQPCKAIGGGDIVLERDIGFLADHTGLKSQTRLTGVIVECQAESSDLTLRINESTSYATSPKIERSVAWWYIQPIDADRVKMTASTVDLLGEPAYGGSIIDQLDGKEHVVATESYGWVKQIGSFPDIANDGKPLKFYYWPLIYSLEEITVVVPSHGHFKFAFVFRGSSEAIDDVFLDGEDLYFRLAARH